MFLSKALATVGDQAQTKLPMAGLKCGKHLKKKSSTHSICLIFTEPLLAESRTAQKPAGDWEQALPGHQADCEQKVTLQVLSNTDDFQSSTPTAPAFRWTSKHSLHFSVPKATVH